MSKLAPSEPPIVPEATILPQPVAPAPSFVTDPRSKNYVQPFVIACMNTALFLGVALAWQAASPGRPWANLGYLFFLVALESAFTAIWLHHPDRRVLDRTAYRAAEWIVIILVMRLYTWVMLEGGLPDLANLRGYLLTPISLFDSDAFFVTLILLLFLWQRTGFLAEIFRDLAVNEGEVWFYSLPPTERQNRTGDQPRQTNRAQLLARFFQHWLWGGIVLAVCTGLSTINLVELGTVTNPLTISRLGLQPVMLVALIVYFVAGFWLLSQARLAVVNARWMKSGMHKGQTVEGSWRRYSLLLLVAIAFIAAFLPIGSTTTIGRILEVIILSGLFLLNALVFILGYLLFRLLSLFGYSQEEWLGEVQQELGELMNQRQPAPPTPLGENTALVLGTLFWLAILVIVVAAVLFFLRDRGYPLNGRLWRHLWHTLTAWLQSAWRGVTTQAQSVSQAIRVRLQLARQGEGKASDRRFIRLNALSPREQIRYFYLSIVRRAGEQGVARRPDETPLEYVEDLRAHWPDTEAEVEELTDAFLRARYSPQPIETTAVNSVKEVWKRVKRNIRRRDNKQDAA